MTDQCSSKGCARYGPFCFEIGGRIFRACSAHREAAERAFTEAKRAAK